MSLWELPIIRQLAFQVDLVRNMTTYDAETNLPVSSIISVSLVCFRHRPERCCCTLTEQWEESSSTVKDSIPDHCATPTVNSAVPASDCLRLAGRLLKPAIKPKKVYDGMTSIGFVL
jgi:hypothetical protein